MKRTVTILGAVSLCLASNAFAKVVIYSGDGRSAYSTSTIFFPQAADIPSVQLGDKITTPSGATVERVDDPKRGLLLKDPNGILWTSSLLAERPFMSSSPRLAAEQVTPAYAVSICKSIGARLPTLSEYRSLAKLFIDQKNAHDPQAAARILDPALPIPGCVDKNNDYICRREKYLTNVNMADEYGYWSSLFDIYGTGQQYKPDNGNGHWDGLAKWESRFKCVVSPDMLAEVDSKKKYEALDMPVMNSCDPGQFRGAWTAEDVVCYDPANTTALMTHPEVISFSFDQASYGFDHLTANGIPGVRSNELTSVAGYRGASGNQKSYWFNASMVTDGGGGNEYTAHSLKSRKDKKGCDVYRVGVSSYETHGQGYKTLKPAYLFTVGIDKKDNSMVLRSNADKVNFCFERIRNKAIEQVLKLRSAK